MSATFAKSVPKSIIIPVIIISIRIILNIEPELNLMAKIGILKTSREGITKYQFRQKLNDFYVSNIMVANVPVVVKPVMNF